MRNLVYAIILSFAVAASWWLANSLSKEEDDMSGRDLKEPKRGFYLRDAILHGTREDGTADYILKARRIDQNLSQQSFDAMDIDLTLTDESGPPWLVKADTGTIPADQRHIQLSGNIKAVRDQPDPTFSLETQSLRLLTEDKVAETDELVIIRYGQQQLTAVGMRAYFNEDRVELQSKVHGNFTP